MLAKRIIPCLDVKNGKVVKGVQFRNHEIIGDIVPLAQRYAEEGADELVFYDIAASSDGRVVDRSWVERIAKVIDIRTNDMTGGIMGVSTTSGIVSMTRPINFSSSYAGTTIPTFRFSNMTYLPMPGLMLLPRLRASCSCITGSFPGCNLP